MFVYLISYDLDKPGQDYARLIKLLQDLGAVKVLYSEWVLQHPWSAERVRDLLRQYMDANDRVLVMQIAGEVAWYNLMISNDAFKKSIAA